MQRWKVVNQAPAQRASNSGVNGEPSNGGPGAGNLELGSTSMKLQNIREKLKAISRSGKSNFNSEAMADLIEEARFNKSAIVDEESAAAELKQLLAMPSASRRAVHLREITEFGRNVDFPPSWHGSDRKATLIWYQVLQALKLVEFDAGDVITREGETGTTAYWLLSDEAELRSTRSLALHESAQASEKQRAAASAAAAQPPTPIRRTAAAQATSGVNPSSSMQRGGTSGAPHTPGTPKSAQPHLKGSTAAAAGGTGSRAASPQKLSIVVPDTAAIHGALDAAAQGKPDNQLSSPTRALGTSSKSASHVQRGQVTQGEQNTAEACVEPETSQDDPDVRLQVWDLVGQEALQGKPYSANIVAVGKVACAALSLEDYRAIVDHVSSSETFESLKVVYLMLMNRAKRTTGELRDLASQLSLFSLFKNMDEAFRLEVCNLVEYMRVPEGFTLFEEGDRIDFCYVILQGAVNFTRYDEKSKKAEDLGSRSTGDHFGTLTTLSSGEKKRPFTATAAEPCELAVISRVGYNRILKKQLQGAIQARIALLQSLSIMHTSTYYAIQRVATNCQDESFNAGTTVVDPYCPPPKVFIIQEGEAKLVWITDDVSKLSQMEDERANGKTKGPGGRAVSVAGSALWEAGGTGAGGGTALAGRGVAARAVGANPLSDKESISGAVAQGAGGRGGGGARGDDGGSSTSLSGLERGNAALPAPRMVNNRRKYSIEVARLGKGDVINGVVLTGRAPMFHVIACTAMKLVSLEADSVDAFLGRESASQLRELVMTQDTWARQRAAQQVAVRQAVGGHIMEPSAHRVMKDSAMKHFLEHYVPSSVTDRASAHEQPHGAAHSHHHHHLHSATVGSGGSGSSGLDVGGGASGAAAYPATALGAPGGASGGTGSGGGAGGGAAGSVAPLSLADMLHAPVMTVEGPGGKRKSGEYGRAGGGAQKVQTGPLAAAASAAAAAAAVSQHIMTAAVAATAGQHTQFVGMMTSGAAGVPRLPGADSSMGVGVQVVGGRGQQGGLGAPATSTYTFGTAKGGQGKHMQFAGMVSTSFLDLTQAPVLKAKVIEVKPLPPATTSTGAGAGGDEAAAVRTSIQQQQPAASCSPHDLEVERIMTAAAGAVRGGAMPLAAAGTQQGPAAGATSPFNVGSSQCGTGDVSQALPTHYHTAAHPTAPAPQGASCTTARHTGGRTSDAGVRTTPTPTGRGSPSGGASTGVGRGQLMSPLPRIPNAPSPVIVSPALKSNVLLQHVSSPRTSRLTQQRYTTVVSGALTPDGELDLEQRPPPRRPSETTASDFPGAVLGGLGYAPSTSWAAFSGSVSQSAPLPSGQGAQSSPGQIRGGRAGAQGGESSGEVGGGGMSATGSPAQGAGGRDTSGRGPQSSTVVILPRMMNVYESVLGGVRVGPMSRRPPRTNMQYASSSVDDVKESWLVPTKSEKAKVLVHGATNLGAVLGTELCGDPSGVSVRAVVGSSWRKGPRGHSRHLGGHRRSGGGSDSDSDPGRDGPLRVIAAVRDDEPPLPLDCDHTAPPLTEHQKLSSPTLHDINYLLSRWGNRWQSERDELLARRVKAHPEMLTRMTPRTRERVVTANRPADPTAKHVPKEFDRPLARLDLFGAVPCAGSGGAHGGHSRHKGSGA